MAEEWLEQQTENEEEVGEEAMENEKEVAEEATENEKEAEEEERATVAQISCLRLDQSGPQDQPEESPGQRPVRLLGSHRPLQPLHRRPQ
jgi:hypothetical protein